MENKTEMGLLLLIIGMLISVFSTLAGLATGTLGSSTLSPGAIIPAILGFFAIILLLAGWVLMLIGRQEFGEKHSQFVIYSVVALVVGFIIAIISGIVMAFSMLSGGLTGIGEEVSIDYADMTRGMIGGLMFGQIGGIFITIGAILLVYCLENDTGRMVLYLALAASIIIAIVGMIFISATLNELADRLEDTPEDEQEDEFYEGLEELGLIDGLGVIGTFILIIGFFIPYNRIKKGDLKPVTPPPRPYGMPQYPPPYPYQPYQQYPQYPPPYGPPQQPPSYPPEVKAKTSEEMAAKVPSTGEAQQPVPVTPVQAGIMECKFCKTQIPEGSTTCPVCKKSLT